MKKYLEKIGVLFLVFGLMLGNVMPAFAAGTEVIPTQTNSDTITIETNLVDGETLKGSIKTFDLVAKDENNNKIPVSNIEVLHNSTKLNYIWDDSTKTSYRLNLAVGENNVLITVNYGGETKTVVYTLYHTGAKPGDVIGQATVSIEAFTVGAGYIVEPLIIDVHEGERASEILDQLLTKFGYDYDYTGSLDNAFYLSGIDGFEYTPNIPTILDEALQDMGLFIDLDDPWTYSEGYLGEFDFTFLSGWMYAINNVFPNVGFADGYVNDGDVMRVQYTLALGMDIGGAASTGGSDNTLYSIANKDFLTTAVAEVNSSEDKGQLLANPAVNAAYKNALDVLANLSPGQEHVDTATADLNSAVNAFREAQALAEAQEAAKAELDNYKDSADYREAEQAELAAAIQAGKDAIDAAADIDAVATALDNAKLVINDIKTDAELAAEEAQALAEAQEAAKAELDNYKDSADYREAEQAELAAAIQAGKDAIGAAADIDAVATALDNAKFAINNIKTDAELTAEELVIGKETAKAELDNYKDADIYREAQRAELASAIEVGKNAIDAAITIADVEVALEVAKADLDTIKTDAELTEEEELLALNEAKESAKLELEGFKNLEDYREAQKAELLNAVEFGKESIDLATDKNGVAVALSEAKDIIRTIKTDAELTAEEVAQALKEAQEAAKAELDNYKDFAAYREAEQNELARIVQAGKEAIDLATTIEAVDIAVNNAKLTMDTINTDAQLTAEEDAQALADAKEAAKSALDGYKDSADYRESEQAELATAIQVGKDVIDAATDIDAVAIALDNAKFAINNIKTDAELTAEEDAQALADAKEAAKSALDGYKDADVYREAEQAELAVAIQAGKDAIDAAETVAEVEAALETAQADMDAIKTVAQLTAEEDSTDGKDPVVPEIDDSEADADKEQTQEVEEKESEETPIAKTGDETPLMAVMSTLLISTSLLAGLLFRKRRNA